MSKELSLKFINSIILLCRIFSATKDPFLNKKLYLKLSRLFETAIATDRVSFSNAIDETYDFLEYTAHWGLEPVLVASAQRGVLKLKLALIKEVAKPSVEEREVGQKKETPAKQEEKIIKTVRREIRNKKLNASQEKILDYIRRSEQARAKQVISEFNDLSERTIKRNLTELHRVGLLTKYAENRAVYYKIK
jgi:hypothetical protein